MKEIIAIIAFLFFSYWFYSVVSIGEPRAIFCRSPFGDKIAILPIIGDSCEIRVKDTFDVVYSIPVIWSWRIKSVIFLDKNKQELGYMEPDGSVYFYTDFNNIKLPENEIYTESN